LGEVVGELGGVLGGEALQIGRVALNRRSVHTQNHRHLRERLPGAAAQKRLDLFVRGIALVAHEALRHTDVTRRLLEQTGSNPADFRLSEFDGRCLVVGRSSSVCARTHPGAAVEHSIGGLAGVHCVVLVQL
jgi:hypothetical protein